MKMKKSRLFAAALCLAAPTILVPALATAHPHKHKHDRSWCGNCGKKQRVAYMGDSVDGYRIPNYVFVYADLDNDGVLRGRELRRAVNRVLWQDKGGRED